MEKERGRLPLAGLLSQRGRTAIVTGGALGIGWGIAARFAEAGAHVAIADIDEGAAQDAAKAIAIGEGKVIALRCDVADEASIKRTLQQTVSQLGRVDVLVNNAGIYPFAPALQMTAADWDRVLAVNLRGLFIFCREFANQVVQQGGGGVIVNIGSIDSLHPSSPGLAAYDASKGGVLMLTRSLALEMAVNGIRVNMIAPGGITTEGTQKNLGGLTAQQAEEMKRQFLSRVPLGRWGDPDDIATATLFVASDAASYMTGSCVVVDGGRLLT